MFNHTPKEEGPRIERQEIHCHDCDQYVQFDLDVNMNGNHVLNCPNCGHEHCRVVRDGVITDTRWDSRNGANNGLPIYYMSTSSNNITTTATTTSATSGSTYAFFTSTGTATSSTGYW